MGIENPVHLLFIAAVALVVLGPKRLPELARSLGKGIRDFRESISEGSFTGAPHVPTSQNPPVAPADAPVDATVVAPPQAAPPPQVAPAPPQAAYPPQNHTAAPPQAVVVAPPPEPAVPSQVDPPEPVRSGDHAPDSRPL
jgi:TatA/E family protein of Tat protein translocase